MKHKYLFAALVAGCGLAICCHSGTEKPVAPGNLFADYRIADGFSIHLAAAEPLIEAPVVMDFDNRGRMWVVEMRGYMPNLAGTGESSPNGRISILEDTDNDGQADRSTVFLDSLVLPRAIAHVYGGLLYAAPPSLWFVEIDHDRPGRKTLVDSIYSDGGNVESQPNALMMNIDNWIYNANSNFRYRRQNGKWLKEPTPFRGQWGMAKDNFGRLYYNSSEIQIAGDYVLPNALIHNPYMKPVAAIDRMLTENQHVYPLHPTTVNRGGEKGILGADSMLVNITAACGPVLYRGDQFPDAYQQNVFVCEPEANLVKRDILHFGALQTTAEQAWTGKEFLASTDEGFRPVNLMNAPDGAIYVIDMHRGIMQHRAYATPYYRNSISRKNLDTLQSAGRILRIVSDGKPLSKLPDLANAGAAELVSLLKSPNGWVRDRAQELLIDRQDTSVAAALRTMALDAAHPISAIHALYTLEGLSAVSFDLLRQTAALSNPMLTAHSLLLLGNYASKARVPVMDKLVDTLVARNDTATNLYIAAALGSWIPLAPNTFLPTLVQLSGLYAGNAVFQEAVVSSLPQLEEKFYAQATSGPSSLKLRQEKKAGGSDNAVLKQILDQTIANRKAKKMNSIFVETAVPVDKRTAGLEIFQSTCSACHGADGEGKENLAPPLKGSPYLEGPTSRLAMILLNGLTGPVNVNGKQYTFNGSMPNFGNNFTDKQISDVIGYLHNSFVVHPPKGQQIEGKIKMLRGKHQGGPLTEEELLKIPGLND